MGTTTIHTQYGALPFALDAERGARVMLVTSRGRGGWIIPKGWPIVTLSPAETAEREAFEEAGVVGEIIDPEPIGAYTYRKRHGVKRRMSLFKVIVYLLRVDRQTERWPEWGQRDTRWFSIVEAARIVADRPLADVIAAFAARFDPAP